MTFTRAATSELAEKVGDKWALKPSTVHSFAISVLLKNPGAGGFPEPLRICDDWETAKIVNPSLKRELGVPLKDVKEHLQEMAAGWESLGAIPGSRFTKKQTLRFLATWGEHRRIWCYTLLSELPYRLREALNDHEDLKGCDFDSLVVDEYQDLNACDLDVIRLIAETRGCSVIAVGDDDQSIYAWRHADPAGNRDFPGSYSDCGDYTLSQSLRCGRKIIEWANHVVQFNRDRPADRAIVAAAKGNPEGVVEFLSFASHNAEATGIAKLAKRLIEEDGLKPSRVVSPFRAAMLSASDALLLSTIEQNQYGLHSARGFIRVNVPARHSREYLMPRDPDRDLAVDRHRREEHRTGSTAFANANHTAIHNHYQYLLNDIHPYRADRSAAVMMGGFSSSYYLAMYSDVRDVFQTTFGAYRHYVMHGIYEQRRPNQFFNPAEYAAINSDLSTFDGLSLLDHWIRYGIKEGRCATRDFHLRYYLNNHTDLVNAFGTSIQDGSYMRAANHYGEWGRGESRGTATGQRLALGLPPGIIVNNSPRSIFVKPENSSDPVEVSPGRTYASGVDGICVPATGHVYKTGDGNGCEVAENNSVTCVGVPMLRLSPHFSEVGQVQQLQSPPEGWSPLFNVCQNPPANPPRQSGAPPDRDWNREFREMDRGNYECERMDCYSRTA